MATSPTGEVTIAQTDYQRGDLFKEIDHDRVANAIRYLSYAKLYYPLEYGFFTKSLATRGATESMEDSNYILALYDFESYFSEFLRKHPGVEQDVNRLSPKEMVDRVDEKLVESARARRDAIRKASQRIVNKTIEQQGLKLNKGEKAEVEKAVGATIQTSIDGAPTTKEFLQSIEESIAPVMLTQIPTVDKSAVAQYVKESLRENPKELQLLFLSDEGSQKEILGRVVFSSLPNKRAIHAIINELPIGQDETKKQFLDRAEAVARTAMVISSDLSQTPAARIEPSSLVSAVLEATGNKTALKAFERLTEQARNAISLTVVAKAWEDTVDVITKRAAGALANTLDPIIQKANQQSMSGPAKHAASLVGDVLGPLLGPAFTSAVELEALNRSLPPGQQLFPDKHSVATFIQSLDATRRVEGAASAALFLTVTTRYPGVQFVEQPSENPLAPVVTIMQFAKDSVAWKIFDRAAKSEAVAGFFGKILGFFGVRVGVRAATGVAGGALGKALGSLVGFFTTGPVGAIVGFIAGSLVVPVFQKVGGWISNLVTGRVGQLGAVIGALEQAAGVWSGARAPSAPKQWYEQDWVPIVIIIAVAVLLSMFGVMMQAPKDAALVTSFEASQLTGRGVGLEGKHTITYTGAAPPFFPVSGCPITTQGRITQCPNVELGNPEEPNPHYYGYGWSNAYDIGLASGSEVFSTHGGYLVEYVSGVPENGGVEYGNYVILAGSDESDRTYYTIYAHLRDVDDSIKQICGGASQCFDPRSTSVINPQQVLGASDNTGNSTGPHLHYELRYADGGKPSFALPEGCGGYSAGVCQ